MLKKTIVYTDYDGESRSEEFHFNLTQAELLELELEHKGGLQKTLEKIMNEHDVKNLMLMFKDIIKRAYGRKSLDGRRFEKSAELTEEFVQTEAYSVLFMELATDAEAAAAFINGIVPHIAGAENALPAQA